MTTTRRQQWVIPRFSPPSPPSSSVQVGDRRGSMMRGVFSFMNTHSQTQKEIRLCAYLCQEQSCANTFSSRPQQRAPQRRQERGSKGVCGWSQSIYLSQEQTLGCRTSIQNRKTQNPGVQPGLRTELRYWNEWRQCNSFFFFFCLFCLALFLFCYLLLPWACHVALLCVLCFAPHILLLN